jgi:hypothetical protein
MASSCPVCAGALDGGELILVCGGCRSKLGVGPVRMTGEFRVPTEFADDSPASASEPSAAACSWCGRAGHQVKKLLGTPQVAICNECVALCADILSAELGPDWR